MAPARPRATALLRRQLDGAVNGARKGDTAELAGIDSRRQWCSDTRGSALTWAERQRGERRPARREVTAARPYRRRAAASDWPVGMAVRRPRHRRGCRGGAGVSRDTDMRGRDSALMAWRAHGCGRVAATRRRRADERAQHGEREAGRWDPAIAIF
jgi:hypothetical protein